MILSNDLSVRRENAADLIDVPRDDCAHTAKPPSSLCD